MLDTLYPEMYYPILLEKIRDIASTEDHSFKESLKHYLLIDSIVNNSNVPKYIKDYVNDHIIKAQPKWFKAWLCFCDDLTISNINIEDTFGHQDLFPRILVSLNLKQDKDPLFMFDIDLELSLDRSVPIEVEEYGPGVVFSSGYNNNSGPPYNNRSKLVEKIKNTVEDTKIKQTKLTLAGGRALFYKAEICVAQIKINDTWKTLPYPIKIHFGREGEQTLSFFRKNPSVIFDSMENNDAWVPSGCMELWDMLKNINIINLQTRI